MRWVAALAIFCLAVATSARADDWGPRRDPFDPGVVRREKAILGRDPHDEGALRRLVALYRRQRTVAKLEAEYRAQLEAGEDWAPLVVLARLPRPARGDSVALWKRAVAVKPGDARGWLALGDAATADATTDATTAGDAYLRAAKIAATPRLQRVALNKLVATARDPATLDAAYGELIALAPDDGMLWLDRGNAQLAAKQLAAAKDSFARAERLLADDPERRLAAITSQGDALEALGRTDEAIAQYVRALDRVPRGYFMGEELVLRIVDAERQRSRLRAATAWAEARWPERTRRHFAWALLGDLYRETHREDRAIDAYRRAVAVAPTEVATHRKLIALLDKMRPSEALGQLEVAARVAPGDAAVQLDLATRYRPANPAKALATLRALARRLDGNVNVRISIAALYEEWNERGRAIGEYEAIAGLEPGDPDHLIVLGEAYWRANKPAKARAAWRRLDKLATPEAVSRHGEVLALHELWEDAVAAYTKSVALDPTAADALYGRARAREALGRLPDAIDDARRAVALTSAATHDDGLRNRTLLVRVLGKAYEAGDRVGLETALARWRFAFDGGEVSAGHLLAAHHRRIRSAEHGDVLGDLYRRTPTDDSLGIAVARSYVDRQDYARARAELERIALRTPARAEEVAELVADVDERRTAAERDIRWQEEGRTRTSDGPAGPDLVGRRHRTGVRVEIGTDVAVTSGARVGIGLYRTSRVARGTALGWRFDWTQHDDDMQEHQAVALGGVIATRVLDARRFELAVGAGPRLELRYGSERSSAAWDRAALGGDVTLELLPRAVPATLGLRLHHSFTDPGRGSALIVELGFEVR